MHDLSKSTADKTAIFDLARRACDDRPWLIQALDQLGRSFQDNPDIDLTDAALRGVIEANSQRTCSKIQIAPPAAQYFEVPDPDSPQADKLCEYLSILEEKHCLAFGIQYDLTKKNSSLIQIGDTQHVVCISKYFLQKASKKEKLRSAIESFWESCAKKFLICHENEDRLFDDFCDLPPKKKWIKRFKELVKETTTAMRDSEASRLVPINQRKGSAAKPKISGGKKGKAGTSTIFSSEELSFLTPWDTSGWDLPFLTQEQLYFSAFKIQDLFLKVPVQCTRLPHAIWQHHVLFPCVPEMKFLFDESWKRDLKGDNVQLQILPHTSCTSTATHYTFPGQKLDSLSFFDQLAVALNLCHPVALQVSSCACSIFVLIRYLQEAFCFFLLQNTNAQPWCPDICQLLLFEKYGDFTKNGNVEQQ